MIFWTAVIVFGAIVFGVYSLVNTFIPDSSIIESSDTKFLLVEEQRRQLTEYSSSRINCKSNLSHLFSGQTGPSFVLNPLTPIRELDSIEVLGSLKDTIVIESRLEGIDTQYYYNYQSDVGNSPFVILLHDFNEIPSTYIDNSLGISSLFFDLGYSLTAPYIYSDPNWINSTNYQLSLAGESLDWIIISKVQSLMDFLDYQYNENLPGNYIVYGKGWGSIIARGTGSVDSRVSLVISEEFPTDPIRDYIQSEFKDLLSNKFIGLTGSRCTSGSLQSFLDLIPTPHILINSERFNSNGKALSVAVNKEYSKVTDTRFLLLESSEDLLDGLSLVYPQDILE